MATSDPLARAAARDRINALDSQITVLRNSIRRLTLERYDLKSLLNAYIYPVLTLPNELVSEIFFQSLSSDTPSDRSPSGPRSPLFLGHICRKWREIALSTPSLWTTIELRLDDAATHERQLRLLELWLSRSGDCPLFISLFNIVPALPIGITRASVHEFVDAVVPHFRRCRSLQLIIPFCDIPLLKGEHPLLRILALGVPDLPEDTHPPDPSWPLQLFHQAPKLELVVVPLRFNPQIVLLPWVQITHASILSAPFHSLAEILRSAVNLVYLRAEIDTGTTHDIMPNEAPDIPPLVHLSSLDLTDNSEVGQCTQIVQVLTLPALVHLRIPELCFVPSPVLPIHDLLSRSGCSLPALLIEITDAQLPRSYYRASWPSVGDITMEGPEGESGTSQVEDENASEEGGNNDLSDELEAFA
ncbi:hypothetical protein C8R44DRAFT_797192 [Mycena epipterygia]|nr:hypothetical protein C8R44DRAFT_797192 [Mycena epipterygia]